MFSWFDAKKASEFGRELALIFEQEMPIEIGKKKEKTIQKRKRALDKMLLKINAFKQENKLNVYKKAKLANTFKWHLLNAGYDAESVEDVTNIILHQL